MLKRNRNKISPLITPFLMSLMMSVINAIIYQGVSVENLIVVVTKKWPIMMVSAIIISQVIIIPFANVVVNIVTKRLESKLIIFLKSLLIVLGMSGCMTLLKLIIIEVPWHEFLYVWLRIWSIIFFIAFILQILVVGPLVKKMNLLYRI